MIATDATGTFTYTHNMKKDFLLFFKHLFSNEGGVSAKRVSGIFGWTMYCTVVALAAANTLSLTEVHKDVLETLAYCSVFLIIGGTVETIVSIIKRK